MTDDEIREMWERSTGVPEQAVAWDVIGFSYAIRNAALEEAAVQLMNELIEWKWAAYVVRALKTKEGE